MDTHDPASTPWCARSGTWDGSRRTRRAWPSELVGGLLSATAHLDNDPALPYARHAIEDARAELGFTVHYVRRAGAYLLGLATRDAPGQVHADPMVRRWLPAYTSAVGRALLAELTAQEVDAVVSDGLAGCIDDGTFDRSALDAELEVVRSRGWAFEEQAGAGCGYVAATVGYRIPATDAISCSVPAEVVADSAEQARIAAVLMSHARKLATTLRREGIR